MYFGTFIIITAFATAILKSNIKKPEFFTFIFRFICTGLLMSANAIYYDFLGEPADEKLIFYITKILTLFQFAFLYQLLLKILQYSKYIQIYKKAAILLIFIQTILLVFSWVVDISPITRVLGCITIIFFCFIFFRDLLTSKPTLLLIRSSSFWIVTGLFFSYSVNLPIYSITPILREYNEYKDVSYQIFSISNMALIVLYFLIIKGYLCLKYPQIQ